MGISCPYSKVVREDILIMKLVIHDLEKEAFSRNMLAAADDTKIISEDSPIHNCIGCFGCWVKTPAVCVIRDKYGDMGEILSKCDTVTIISKCFYGGFSPFVKNVVDRSISFVLPYFTTKNGEMHHKTRYDSHFNLQVIFYGEDITEKEKQTATKLAEANSVNLHCKDYKISFVKNLAELEGLTI
jgi:multimeric flavodoxin WrbA